MSRFPAGGPRSEHNTPQLSPIHSNFPMELNSRTSPREGHMNPPVSLPSLRQLSSTPPTPSSQRHPDPFLAILNPQDALIEQQRDRRRTGSQAESPSPVTTQTSQSLPSISRPPSVESVQDEHMPARHFPPPARPSGRHVLSPKSARGVHLTANAPTGAIDARQQPFLSASTRPTDLATSQSSLPTPPIGNRVTYFPPNPTVIPTTQPMHHDGRRASAGFPLSGSVSPTAQYSPYSRPASIEPSQYDSSGPQPPYVLSQSNIQMHDARMSAGADSDRNMIAMAPSGQSSIQLMTIKSQMGHPVQIPVDVQAASKVADEKRRRNAGASARFRARRKEKEREASQSISRLEQQLRDAQEDAEYYRTERDHFKSIVFQQPHPERHYARPPSPRLRRLSAPSRALSSPRGDSVDSYADYEEDNHEAERNVRRRTSNYIPPSGPPSSDLNAMNPASHGQIGPGYGSAFSANTANGNPHPHMGYREQSSPVALQHQQPERPSYREAYTADSGRFEARNWAPGHPSHRDN